MICFLLIGILIHLRVKGMKNDLKRQVERGEVSLRSAAYRLMRAGKCTFLPNDREVIRLLHIVI